MSLKIKTIIVFSLTFVLFGFPKKTLAQSCSGSVTCVDIYARCTNGRGSCSALADSSCLSNNPGADVGDCDYLDLTAQPPVQLQGDCVCDSRTQATLSCSTCGQAGTCSPTCGTVQTSCDGYIGTCSTSSCGNGICESSGGENSTTCPADCPVCGAGFQYCGGCINSCRSNSQTCAAHIAAECTPTAPSCNAPYWCVGPSQYSACTSGVSGTLFPSNGYCNANPAIDATMRICCSACNNGTFTQVAGCGANGCPACSQGLTHRASSNPSVFCGSSCTSDSNCSVSSCSPRCGQANGCGGTCSNADAGAPGATTLYPPNGGNMDAIPWGGNYYGGLLWSAATNADTYYVQITPTGGNCSSPNAVCTYSTAMSYTYLISNATGPNWTAVVVPYNTKCGTVAGPIAVSSFTIMANITGNVISDANANASLVGSSCVDPDGRVGLNPPAVGQSVGADGYNGSVTGSFIGSSYSVRVPIWLSPANNIVTYVPGTDALGNLYQVTCPAGAQWSGVASPSIDKDFYVTATNTSNGGWWQASAGQVYAGNTTGEALRTYIPTATCSLSATCSPYMISTDSTNNLLTAGIPITGGGSVDTTNQPGNQTGYLTHRFGQQYAIGSVTTRVQENYDFFYREYSMGTAPTDDFAASANNAQKPSAPPIDSKRAYYRNGDLTITDTWNVLAGEEIVVFVNGNLNLSDPTGAQQLITVANGGFLSFVVNGNITINENVGNNVLTNTTANLAGVYIADGTIFVQSRGQAAGGDDRFVGEGTFVGLGGITLARTFTDGGARNAQNNDKPVELFRYRPDFVQNVPERMARPHYVWQETN